MTPVFPINNYNNDNKAPAQSIGSLGMQRAGEAPRLL